MIEIWIPITLAAAFLQNVRSALQKHLSGSLSTSGATFVRFSYGFPLAILYVTGLAVLGGLQVPRPNPAFLGYATMGGLAQIFATALLIRLFAFRNFAVGTTYSKTETVQTALFGIIILGESLSLGAMLGILISLIGVMAISVAKTAPGGRGLLSSLVSGPALIGIASGGFFGVAGAYPVGPSSPRNLICYQRSL